MTHTDTDSEREVFLVAAWTGRHGYTQTKWIGPYAPGELLKIGEGQAHLRALAPYDAELYSVLGPANRKSPGRHPYDEGFNAAARVTRMLDAARERRTRRRT